MKDTKCELEELSVEKILQWLAGVTLSANMIGRFQEYLLTVLEVSSCYNRVFRDEKIPLTTTFVPVGLRNISRNVLENVGSESVNAQLLANKSLICGNMGSGKSTLLHYFILKNINELSGVPIFIELRYDQNLDNIKEYISVTLKELGFSDLKEVFLDLYAQQKLYLICDGIDNCNPNVISHILEEVKSIQVPYLLTSTISYRDELFKEIECVLDVFEIQEFKYEDAVSLVKNYDRVFNLNCLGWLSNIISVYSDVVKPLFESPFLVSCIYWSSIVGQKLSNSELDLMKNDPRLHPLQNMNINIGKLKNRLLKKNIKSDPSHVRISNHMEFDLKKKHFHPSPKDLVIEPFSGGLGDHLMYSHLPRVAKEYGRYERVLISDQAPCRSKEAKYLIWELNPYVDGYCIEESNNFHVEDIRNAQRNPVSQGKKAAVMYEAINNSSASSNVLDNLMLKLGIDDNVRGHEPEIYYQPLEIDPVGRSRVYDPYYVSNPRIDIQNQWLVEEFFKKNRIELDFQMRFSNDNGHNYQQVFVRNFISYLSTLSLRDFCDVLFSANEIYCLTTGTASLSSALNKKATVLIGEKKLVWHHSKINQYVHLV
ncbi:MAG: NACHT domain-containing NTPase [Marinifilaceae bacterium]